MDDRIRRLAGQLEDVQRADRQPSPLPSPSPSPSPPRASTLTSGACVWSNMLPVPHAHGSTQGSNQQLTQCRIILKTWQLAALAANRVSAAIELQTDIRCATASAHALKIWRHGTACQQRARRLHPNSKMRQREWQYKRAGFQGFLFCAWKAARTAHGDMQRSHAGAQDAKVLSEKLQEQLDLALDNLTEANEALHKSRKHEQALKNQVQELTHDRGVAHEQAERAQKQAAEAHEVALKATQDVKDSQDYIHELTLQNSQLELEVEKSRDNLVSARQDCSDFQLQIQELTRQNSALELDASAAKQAASDIQATSVALDKKREGISKEYRDLAAQMQDLKEEFSRCSMQKFAHFVIANLNATIHRLHQMDDLSRSEMEREKGVSAFMLPSQENEWIRLRSTDEDLKNSLSNIQHPDQYLNVSDLRSLGDGRRETVSRDSAKVLALERQLERRNLQIQELESKLKWQQAAGDEAAMELGRALKLVRKKDAELAHVMTTASEEIKCMRSCREVNMTQTSEFRRLSSSSSASVDEGEMDQQDMDFTASVSNINKTLAQLQDLVKEEDKKIVIARTEAVTFPDSVAVSPKTSAEERAQILQDELRSLTYRNECLIGQIQEVECELTRKGEEVERLQNDFNTVQQALDNTERKCAASEAALEAVSQRLCRAEAQAKEVHVECKGLRSEVMQLSTIQQAVDSTDKYRTASEKDLDVLIERLRSEVASAQSLQARAEAKAKEAHADTERLRSEVERLRAEGCSDQDLIAQLSSCEEEILSMIEALQEERAGGKVAREHLKSELVRERLVHNEEMSAAKRDAALKLDDLAAEFLELKMQKEDLIAENESLRRLAAGDNELSQLQTITNVERSHEAQKAAQRPREQVKKNAAKEPGDLPRDHIFTIKTFELQNEIQNILADSV